MLNAGPECPVLKLVSNAAEIRSTPLSLLEQRFLDCRLCEDEVVVVDVARASTRCAG